MTDTEQVPERSPEDERRVRRIEEMRQGELSVETLTEMVTEYDERFAQRLKEIRSKRGLSAQKLADISGVHRRAIFKIENGERGVSIGEAVALADALEIRDPSKLCREAPIRLRFEVLVD